MQNSTRDGQARDDDLIDSAVAALINEPDPLRRYQALTRAQGVHEAVTKRIAAERARAVAEMHGSGLSYARIAEVIGFTRSRAQQLVERAEPPPKIQQLGAHKVTQEDITSYLEGFTSDWPRYSHYARWNPAVPYAHAYSVEQIAGILFADAEFRALKLGTWLNTPDGELMTAAAESLSTPLFAEDVKLLVEALKLAAKMQQGDVRGRSLAGGLLIAAGTLILAGGK